MNNGNNPISPIVSAEGWLCCTGLTKREYFAAMAMQGLVNQQAPIDRVINEDKRILTIKIAEAAVILADATLKKLEETSNPS
jgi:hypothetical protein